MDQKHDMTHTQTSNMLKSWYVDQAAYQHSHVWLTDGLASMFAESTQPSTPLAKAHSLPVLSAGDWMRRGLLAERLYHDIEALQAYRCCLAVTARGESILIYFKHLAFATATFCVLSTFCKRW